MSLRRTLAIGFLLMALTPAAARADGLLVPFAGVNFGGDAGETFSDGTDANRLDWGVSFAWFGGGVFGFEGGHWIQSRFLRQERRRRQQRAVPHGERPARGSIRGQKGFGIRPVRPGRHRGPKSDLESFDKLVGFDDSEAPGTLVAA